MPQIIKDFVPQGGCHCITTSLKQIFTYYGWPMSEAMLFGLGAGLDFTYINLAASPMVSGRDKVLVFEENLARSLGITIKVKQSKDSLRVFETTRQMLAAGDPVLVYADMPYLDYLGMEPDSHFGGHSVVLFGYDDQQEHFYVSDRDHSSEPIRTPKGSIAADYHLVSYQQLAEARGSRHRPFPANNKYLTFNFSGFTPPSDAVLAQGIRNVCQKMLLPPANLKGLNGIGKFAKEIRKWRKFPAEKLRRAGITNYFQIHQDGGTGGGIFRKLYGCFLLEAAVALQLPAVTAVGQELIVLAAQWDGIASQLWQLYETGNPDLLEPLAQEIETIQQQETVLFGQLHKLVKA